MLPNRYNPNIRQYPNEILRKNRKLATSVNFRPTARRFIPKRIVRPFYVYRRAKLDKGNKMLRKLQKTLSVGLSGLVILGIGIGSANAAETVAKRTPNVLHEMVPHVILPETIQYNKTAKNVPGAGYTSATSPYVGTYVAFPSYQVPYTAAFRQVGQSVYPVSPPLLPAPLPQEQPEPDTAVKHDFAWHGTDSDDIVLSNRVVEPIQLASNAPAVAPPLPMPGAVVQTRGFFCQQPAKPPAAWAFSSPLFKVASVPAGWGGQTGGIVHGSPRGSIQNVGFHPVGGVDPATVGQPPQGMPMPHSACQNFGPQVQVLPNGMLLLTTPPNHANCGLIRCRSSNSPRTILLPPAGFGHSQMTQPQMMQPQMMQPQAAPPQAAMMHGGFGTPFMQVSQQPMMPQAMMQQPMMPQMQVVPVTAMTPMGPAVVGYQQVPMMPPMMNPIMNPMAMDSMAMNPMVMMDPQMQQLQQLQMAVAVPNSAVTQAFGATVETGENALQPLTEIGSAETAEGAMQVVATPFGYSIQVPVDALQADAAAQLAQMQQALIQSQMQTQMQMQMNPHMGWVATPFGYVAMNQPAGQFGFGQPMFGQPMMMPVGNPMGMSMQGQGLSVSDMLQILSFINSNKPQQRRRLAERIAERRENRRESVTHDPFTQLMQAWTSPFVSPDTTLRMPARNAYPYGHFGVQTPPMSTANYGGFHNLYFGNTTYPGLF